MTDHERDSVSQNLFDGAYSLLDIIKEAETKHNGNVRFLFKAIPANSFKNQSSDAGVESSQLRSEDEDTQNKD